VVPAFHKQYYEAMVQMFGACTEQTVNKLDALLAASGGRRAGAGQAPVGARAWPASPPAAARLCSLLLSGCRVSWFLSHPRSPVVVNMETEFLNLGLDIIGLGVRRGGELGFWG
jgi:hypothetical protein